MPRSHRRALWTGLVLGALAFLSGHLPDLGAVLSDGLFFGASSRRRLLVTGGAMVAAVVVAGAAGGRHWRSAAVGVWSGAFAALVCLMLVTGPGNLWPIALAIGGVLALGPVLLGALLGWSAGRVVGGRPVGLPRDPGALPDPDSRTRD